MKHTNTIDDAIHFLNMAAIIISGYAARNAFDAIEWYVRTARASTAYEAALKVITRRRALTIIEKMALAGGSTDDLVVLSKSLLKV